MRLGLIGLGRFSQQQHTPSLLKCQEEFNDLEIIACDRSTETRQAWSEMFGLTPSKMTHTELIASGQLDAAYVLVPPTFCCETVLPFLEAKIPVFTEKPPGLNSTETQQLADAAGDLPHAVGFNRRKPTCRGTRD